MALKSSRAIERPDHTKMMAGTEGSEFLQDNQKIITRSGAVSSDADFDPIGYDLDPNADGDYRLSTVESSQITDAVPDTGGSSTMAIFIESDDDTQFSVEVEWTADDGTTVLGTVDSNIDADLQSTSPTGGNHYVYVTVSMASDKWDILISSDGGAGVANTINGSINVH